MEYKKLSECADFRNERTKQIDFETYISTENMLPNKAGVSTAESLPDVKTTTKYLPKDILLSNIRPYFKKIWFSNREGGCSNDVLVVTAKQGVNPNYLYYVLSDNNFFNYDTITSKGTKMPRGTPKAIMKYLVPDVDKDYQDKIVFILSRYDSLIEKNNKRIKVLEQMAENLYKEWFVRFRFPGYETAKFENGIPKGWETSKFSLIANILSGGTPSTEHDEYYGGEIPFYTPKDSIDNFFVFDTLITITENGLRHCNSQLYPENTIMITARGTVGNLNLLASPMAMNQSCYAINSDVIYSQYFLFFLLKREILKLKKMASGGVFDTIIISTFDHIKVTVPDKKVIKVFDRVVTPIMEEAKALMLENRNLIKQRDLLLPRLMSGKLEV